MNASVARVTFGTSGTSEFEIILIRLPELPGSERQISQFLIRHSVFSSGLLSASSFQFFCIISAINVSPFHQIVHSSDSIGHFFHSSCLGVLVFLLTSHPPAIHSRVPSPLANSLAGHRGRQYRGYIHCGRKHIDKTSSSSLILPIDILNSR